MLNRDVELKVRVGEGVMLVGEKRLGKVGEV
jgi:hypothetical protein